MQMDIVEESVSKKPQVVECKFYIKVLDDNPSLVGQADEDERC